MSRGGVSGGSVSVDVRFGAEKQQWGYDDDESDRINSLSRGSSEGSLACSSCDAAKN